MKDIKLRFWDYDLKQFYYFTLNRDCNFEDLEHILNEHRISEAELYTVLKEKKGDEIEILLKNNRRKK